MRTGPIRTGRGKIIATAPNEKMIARFFSLFPPSKPTFRFPWIWNIARPFEKGNLYCKNAPPLWRPVLPCVPPGGRKWIWGIMYLFQWIWDIIYLFEKGNFEKMN